MNFALISFLLVNGMPLAFVEVKTPNNKKGMLAERDRINERFQNKRFRRFANITQLMVFSVVFQTCWKANKNCNAEKIPGLVLPFL